MGNPSEKIIREKINMNALKVREVLYEPLEKDFETYILGRAKEFEFQTFGLMDEEFNKLIERQYKERKIAVNKIMHSEINKFMLRSGFFRDNEEIDYLVDKWKGIWLKHTDMFI